MSHKKYSYYKFVDYSLADPAKILAQKEGKKTAKNLKNSGFTEFEGSRGESAYVFDMGEMHGAFLEEGLGTKSLITQKMYELTGISYFAAVAQDTVASIINDLITVGATPVVLNAYWSASSYKWLEDKKLAEDFIKGWGAACEAAGVTWGGGETQSLPDVVQEGALEFAGAAFGVVKPKERLTLGDKLSEGDAIILFESSGIHANGVSSARNLAMKLEKGYLTPINGDQTFGEGLLAPTILYAKTIQELFYKGVDIHYMANITGHGWRKIMRHKKELTYRLTTIPPIPKVLEFLQEKLEMNEEEAYGTFNMGAGFAVFVSPQEAEHVLEVAMDNDIKAYYAGVVEKGPKQVVIEPKDIVYEGKSLELKA